MFPMPLDLLNTDTFRILQDRYEAETGYHLVLADQDGSIQMGIPDCVKFPCMRSCRECRERIVREAIRTGEICIDNCHEGYLMWGLPYSIAGKVRGGLIVLGSSEDIKHRYHFEGACLALYQLMKAHSLLPEEIKDPSSNEAVACRFLFRKAYTQLASVLDEHFRPFLTSLQTAEFTEATQHFSEIRKAITSARDLPLDVVLGLIGDLVTRARHQLIDAGLDPYACSAEAGIVLMQLSEVRNAEEAEKALEPFLERFMFLARQKTKDPDDVLIEKATSYLEQHISQDLSRERVSRAVGLSPSHFSRLIREKKGRTFTDLLNQYRIERACTLLIRSHHTLAQIASECGFCDQSYFSKVFRRYKGRTPARYRDEHQL
jgi:AraC-like DNA-binding protein